MKYCTIRLVKQLARLDAARPQFCNTKKPLMFPTQNFIYLLYVTFKQQILLKNCSAKTILSLSAQEAII